MNILTIVNELKAEKVAGNEMAEQLLERIDCHIRDLETLKAWVRDCATARDMALGSMLGMEQGLSLASAAPAAPAALGEIKNEAAEQ